MQMDFFLLFITLVLNNELFGLYRKCAESRTRLLGIAKRLSDKVKMTLKICDFDEIPRLSKFFAFFPYVKQDCDRIRRMLNACNPQLQEIKWEVIRRKEISSGINLLILVDKETAGMLVSDDGSLIFGAGTAHFRELIPRSKKVTGDSSEAVEIRLDDETTDAQVDHLDKLANLSLEEVEKRCPDKTNVESAGTSEKPNPDTAPTDIPQGKFQFTIRGIGNSSSIGKKPKKKKRNKHSVGTGSSAKAEQVDASDSGNTNVKQSGGI